MYRCWNPVCPFYVGFGTILRHYQTLPSQIGGRICYNCHTPVDLVPNTQNAEPSKPIVGIIGGAAFGAAIGGLPGAVIGGLIGLILGNAARSDRER
jgi:hypothetical protein